MKRQLWTVCFALAGMLCLIFDSGAALEGARQGVDLCLKTVIPSLFPFFVCSLLFTGNAAGQATSLLRPIAKLFSLPIGSEAILVPAFLGGYPAGAQSVAHGYRSGRLDKFSAQRMLAFCSNAGPAFLFGMAGAFFSEGWMVWLLWGIHIISAWMVSTLFPACGSCTTLSTSSEISFSDAVAASVKTMALVCGWVVLFRVMLRFLERWLLWLFPTEIQVLLAGILELTNGCCGLGNIQREPMRFLICSVMLAFGGICVMMQTASVIKGLELKYYAAGKALQALFSLFLAAAFVYRIWILAAVPPLFFLFRFRKTQKRCSIPGKAVV